MSKSETLLIQGKLISAATGGGERALWNIARGEGDIARAANIAIELATSPFHDVSLIDAIILATKDVEGGEK